MITGAKNYTKIHKNQKLVSHIQQTPSLQLLPKVYHLNFGMIHCSGIPQMQGTSSWLWVFNLLLCRLHREISLSIVCSRSSWGSALDLALPLCVSHPLASVLRPDRMWLKERLIRGLWLTQAGAGEGGVQNVGRACGGRSQCDTATAWGMPFVLPGKLSLDHGTLAVAGCTGSGRGGVDSDLCLHTGFLVTAAAALTFHAHPLCSCS